MIDSLEFEPEGTADHEAKIAATAAALFQEVGKSEGIRLPAVSVQQRDESLLGQAARHAIILTNLDQLKRV